MKFTFAPFSTNSIPIKTPNAFRFVAMQTTPVTNMTAPTIKKWETPTGSVNGLNMAQLRRDLI